MHSMISNGFYFSIEGNVWNNELGHERIQLFRR